jgi:methionyl-tRNA formyltransferase
VRVLFLGPGESPTSGYLRQFGEDLAATTDPIDPQALQERQPEFLVSHGYRHIISRDVLELMPDRAINLHISYLPWNRGADPNLWSWVEDTPKGVTIHYIDAGVDTGDIIAQRQVAFGDGETLSSSYARLQEEIDQLFREQWPAIRSGRCARRAQQGEGSSHRVGDRERVEHLLASGWDTSVRSLSDQFEAHR